MIMGGRRDFGRVRALPVVAENDYRRLQVDTKLVEKTCKADYFVSGLAHRHIFGFHR